VRVADLQVSSNRDRLLISDLSMLGGHAGLGGYSPGRFHDLDLLLMRLAYVFPLERHFELDLHSEWAPSIRTSGATRSSPRCNNSFGFSLRARDDRGPRASIGFDFSPEAYRLRSRSEVWSEAPFPHSRPDRRARPGRPSVRARGGPDSTGSKPPEESAYSPAYDLIDNSVVRPPTRFFDVARLARRLTGHPREAANVDENDQVRLPSTWWQPRLGFRPVTPEQMMTGPGPGTGPAPGRWTVTSAKRGGMTFGFQIKGRERRPVSREARPAGPRRSRQRVRRHRFTPVLGGRVQRADNTIAYFRTEDLDVDQDATYTDARGHKQPITQDYITQLLAKGALRSTAAIAASRAAFSRQADRRLPIRRPAQGRSRDLIPHELRRELRGLWTLCAWLNHADSRAPNSLDTWVKGADRSFVRHHLVDFSAILGAGATGARAYPTGTEYYVDAQVGCRELVTLGLAPFAWERTVDPGIPSVGFVESKEFDPSSWRPDYPNPAFDDRTERDIRWGARIVAGFSDEMIRTAVAAGRYSDPRAAEYVTQVLIERRDKLVRRWLGDNFTLEDAVR